MPRVRDQIAGIVPYKPGKPISELQRELGVSQVIKLASNENPVGPSPKAVAALREMLDEADLHRYPDGGGFYLKQALSEKWGLSPDHFILGNGSNEIIEFLCRTFVGPGEEVVAADLTFVVYRLITTAAGGRITEVPLRDFTHDLPAMAAAVGPDTRLLFVCNPNNPTGTHNTAAQVADLLSRVPDDLIVVFDEAYAEYVDADDYPDTVAVLRSRPNTVILRTFSKVYGLPALRIGYGITSPEIVDYLNRVRQPFNTNELAQRAALAALDDTDHVDESIRINAEGKARMYRFFGELGLEYLPTQANFVYVNVGMDGGKVFDACLREGVILRHIHGDWVRVTVGLPSELDRFESVFRKVMSALGHAG
ncbi:MAG: histidinol-phosphate transaminase [Nitrospirota bacterium]|nr:histidinol-phosphate transaminase [Nitrospirota bacterium]